MDSVHVVVVPLREGTEESEERRFTDLLRSLPRIRTRSGAGVLLEEEEEESTSTPLHNFGREDEYNGYPSRYSFLPTYPLVFEYDGYNEYESRADLEPYIYQERDLLFPTATYAELDAGADGVARGNDSGLSEGVINQHLKSRMSQEMDLRETCAICLDDYLSGESIAALQCRHEYHLRCIVEWILVDNSCPLCRCQAFSM